jgi:hypothetical protein
MALDSTKRDSQVIRYQSNVYGVQLRIACGNSAATRLSIVEYVVSPACSRAPGIASQNNTQRQLIYVEEWPRHTLF